MDAVYTKPYFMFNPDDHKARDFAALLQEGFSAVYGPETCDHVADVGGDGTIYYGMNAVPDKPHFAVKAPTSQSVLYYGHHGITTSREYLQAVNGADLYELHPVQADISFSDGTQKTVRAHAEIIIERFSAQALFAYLSSNTSNAMQRIGCDSLMFASAMGSTGSNRSYHGHILPLDSSDLVVTGGGVFAMDLVEGDTPLLGRDGATISAIFNKKSRLDISFDSAQHKRFIKISFDGSTMLPDGSLFDGLPCTVSNDRVIKSVAVGLNANQTNRLLLNKSYRRPHIVN